MALTEFLILRKPRSGCLEERTALARQNVNYFTRSPHERSQQHTPVGPLEAALALGSWVRRSPRCRSANWLRRAHKAVPNVPFRHGQRQQ